MARGLLQERWQLPLLFLLMGLLTGLLALLAPPSPQWEALPNRSLYNHGESGYRAWYLACRKAGLPVLVWEKPFSQLSLLPAPATMLMVEPYTVAGSNVIFGQKEASALLAWVAEGNTLVLLDDFQRFGSNPIVQALGLRVKRPLTGTAGFSGETEAKKPAPVTETVLHVASSEKILASYVYQPLRSQTPFLFGPLFLHALRGRVLLENERRQPVLVQVPYGQGALVLGTPVDLGSNRHLHQPPNDDFQFLANLLSVQSGPVFINEFVHGYTEADSLFGYYQQKTPLGDVMAQLGLAFVGLLWLSFVRWMPQARRAHPKAQARAGGGGPGVYIRSVAGIYARTQSASLALALQIKQIDHLLRQRHRVQPEDAAGLRRLLESLATDYSRKQDLPEAWEAALTKARIAVADEARLSSGALLGLAKTLSGLESALRQNHQPAGRPHAHGHG